jgi:TATA-box binding protein (TBP) (component of TFIID and TFIIIB)
MDFKIVYDHSNLRIADLHKEGIRSTKELEKVIEGISVCDLNESLFEFSVYIFTGLTARCKGVKVAITVNTEGKYVTLAAEISEPKELLKKLCKR